MEHGEDKTPREACVIGVDPGRDKCGLAALTMKGKCVYHQVVATETLVEQVGALCQKYSCDHLVIGNGTTSGQATQKLQKALTQITIHSIDEYKTTEEARKRYWQDNPPQGWQRLLPQGLRVPPTPVDDYAALIMAERFLENIRRQ